MNGSASGPGNAGNPLSMDELGAQLKALVTWNAPAPDLWRAALDSDESLSVRRRRRPLSGAAAIGGGAAAIGGGAAAIGGGAEADAHDGGVGRPARSASSHAARFMRAKMRRVAGYAVAMLCVALVIGILLPSVGKARAVSHRTVAPTDADRERFESANELAAPAPPSFAASDWDKGRAQGAPAFETMMGTGGGTGGAPARGGISYGFGLSDPSGASRPEAWANKSAQDAGGAPGDPGAAMSDAPRAVARSASIELVTDDVRAAFLRAGSVVDTIAGEFVEGSQFLGEKESASATIALRVRNDRLGAVLAKLREIGTVASEQQRGDDVTDQIVDLEARIRVERRMEQEMLGLLDERVKSPLKDVLELRAQLGEIRRSIEKMVAQQVQLERLVSLARVLVTIHPPADKKEPVKAVEKDDSLGTYFFDSMRSAWRTSLRALTDAVAFLTELAIGGLPWWIGLASVGFLLRAWWKRRINSGAI